MMFFGSKIQIHNYFKSRKKIRFRTKKEKKSFEYFLVISKRRATIHHHFLKWVNFAASSSSKRKFWLVTRQRRESWGGRCLASKWDWRRGWQHAKWHSHYNYSRGRAEPRVLPTDDDGLDIRFSTYKVSHQTVDNNHWLAAFIKANKRSLLGRIPSSD